MSPKKITKSRILVLECHPRIILILKNAVKSQDLESLFAETNFNKIVSHQYIDNNNGEDWKEFFKKIGVAEEIRILHEPQPQSVNFQNRVSYLKFINVISQGLFYLNYNYSYKNLLEIKDFLDYCINPCYSTKFWQYIIQSLKRFDLTQKATIWIKNQAREVPNFFEFDVKTNPSIPCTDNKCRKPSEVYSYSLQSYLKNSDLPVSSIDFPEKIESFLGLKRLLDLENCLMLLEQIANNYYFSKDTKQLYFIYEQLNNLIENNPHEEFSIDLESIQLLACDDLFHPISELYYIAPELNLPSKRNPNLVKFPEIDRKSFNFAKILSAFGIKKISLDDIKINYNSENHCSVLPKLIQERASCISVYLTSSSYDKQYWINKIIQRLENLTIYRVEKLSYYSSNIDYEEPIYNFYDEQSNTIYYVGEWNSRRNSKLGNYLIKALGLNYREITGERLLDFLDNSMEEIVLYLQDSGCDVTGLLPDNQIENKSEKTFSFLGDNSLSLTLPTYYQGTGNNAEYWGNFGEDKAIQFYQALGYEVSNVSNQPQKGYDLECIKDGQEIFVEVKTISSSNEVIRITINEWRCMCHGENQQKYELFIVVHQGKSIEKYIQVKSVWVTLQEILSKLDQQELTSSTYNSESVEFLIGFQRNSKNQLNEVLINWKRLFDKGFHGSEKIQYYLEQ
ncbi:hypothetical protein PCC7424_2629 [Gloeothece citriformis PCC 7424]|uniref:Protein NO VEIN C-terminal domain-containing protein n=1 Tax=Gloeothece citriformis (strain PCC 7424) TaxID=65393 RepID=B7KKS4_GLOC7|nr:DUF3883 domain-containing protein [Gloeothece citriformis]ACK71043.1 hypothetical protein PCC7424_2629 [Gloeothece citriformis PCC 7424]